MAIEGPKSIVDLLCCLWNCAVPQVDYIRKLKKNHDALNTAMVELKALRDDTMTKVRQAEQQPDMKQTKQVENWLSGVRDMEVEVEKLIRDTSQEIEKKCLGGCCPKNCKTSYKLGKIVAEKLKEVADLRSRGSFEAVADKQPLPLVDYIRKLKENKDALETAMNELKALRDDTMTKVCLAEQQPDMKRTKQVENWLSVVRDMEVEVEVLIRDASQEIEKKCLGGCCPKNCEASNKLEKIVAEKLKAVADLKSRGSFEAVANKQPLPLVDERPSELTVGLESTFDKVWSCIEDERTGIIGLYGPGGVGKTTLLTQINNKFSNTTHKFDVVIWTVVSSNPNSAKVQEDIGKKIGFNDDVWKQKSQEDKALDVFRVLRKKKFILLVDDIWARFDLSKVGVPLPDEQNKSKVVFTTRSKDVCAEMDVHKLIKIECLAWEEAWALFRKKVGEDTINFHLEILELAKIVAKECDGLPLALIVIGRAMAPKTTPHEWQHAVTMLQKSTGKISGMEDKVYSRLKLSYDNLSDEILRSCFLYCSLFPEDFSISNEGLIEYWIGEGFLDGFDDLNEAKNQGQTIISTLIRACLLEEDSSFSVKMHDVIRDMALWIAGECEEVNKKFLVRAGVNLIEAPKVKKWEGVERVSLMHNDIMVLTEIPISPDLSTLFLNSNAIYSITRGFFQKMPNLRVLDLSWNRRLYKLPKEISELVLLQYLNLSGTKIKEFPIDYKKLVELKYLNFEDTNDLNKFPMEVLSSFKKLRVLKMVESKFVESIVEDSEFETLVQEVECLKELIELTITISTTSALSRFLSCHKLPSFTTKLWLISLEGSEYVDICRLQSMRCLREFSVHKCDDLKHLKAERANLEPCFPSLREVRIFFCRRLKELTCLIFAPNLENLVIHFCDGMEEVIWSEATKEGGYLNPFAKLKQLQLFMLPQMKSIYPNALPFPCLNFIGVSGCQNLKKLPLNSDSAKGCGLVIKGYKDWWNDLEWENEATRNAFLPSFQSW